MASSTPEMLSHLLDYPIQAPPPGETANFTDPKSIAYQVYITAAVCIPLVVVFSLLRFVSKTCYSRKSINIAEESQFPLIPDVLFCIADRKTYVVVFVAGLVGL